MKLPPHGPASLRLPKPGEAQYLICDNSNLPVNPFDRKALLQLLPAWAREGDLKVRDAHLKAAAIMTALFWASAGRILRAQSSPRFASGVWLAWHGKKRKIPRALGESEFDYRQRLLARPDRISPRAIKAGVDEIVERLAAPLRAIYQEPAVDCLFLSDVDADGNQLANYWSGFWQDDDHGQRIWGWESTPPPDNVKRGAYWEDEPVLGGFFRIILPFDAQDEDSAVWLADADGSDDQVADPGDKEAFYAADDVDDNELSFWCFDTDSLSDQIIHEVEALRGGGVIWELLIDPLALGAI